MLTVLNDVLQIVLGVTFGFLGIAFAVIAFRLFAYGADAYSTNQRLTPKNPFIVWKGQLKANIDDIDGRMSHGVALNIRTGKLEEQRRLSTEAIDDVIGRPAS